MQIVMAAEDPFPLPKVDAAVYEMDALPEDAAQRLLNMVIQTVHGSCMPFSSNRRRYNTA